MRQQVKVFLARIVNITKNSEGPAEGRQTLWVRSVDDDIGGSGFKIRALPPNITPTSASGSGFYTTPEKGQLCIVWSHQDYPTAQILNYVNEPGTSAQGILTQQLADPGSFLFKIGGLTPVKLELSKKGYVNLYAGPLANLSLDNKARELEVTAAKFSHIGAAFTEKSHLSDGTGKYHRAIYAKADWKSFTDAKIRLPWKVDSSLALESTTPHPITTQSYKYVDKFTEWVDSSTSSPLYSSDTREAVNPFAKQDKTVLTYLTRGYQEDEDRSGLKSAKGTVWEWLSVKNTKEAQELIYDRWGKIDSKSQNSEYLGEIRRFSAFEGSSKGILPPKGVPLHKPLPMDKLFTNDWSEKGYKQTFFESWGELVGKEVAEPLQGSIFRKKVSHNDDVAQNYLKYHQIIGGEGQTSLVQEKFTSKTTLQTILWEKSLEVDDFKFLNLVESGLTRYKILVTDENYRQELIGDEFALSESIDKEKWEILTTTDGKTSKIKTAGDEITITNDSGAKITIVEDKITLKTSKTTLKLDGGTFTVGNDTTELMDILTQALDLLFQTTAPGYGAPISTFTQFKALHQKLIQLGP